MNHSAVLTRPIWNGLRIGLPIACLFLIMGCGDSDPTEPVPGEPLEFSFTLDEDLQGWEGVATDTLEPAIDWHARHATDVPESDDSAAEIHLENLNDQGKVWIERPFELDPGVQYEVEVRFDFATADWGAVNLFTMIAGVHPTPPRSADALTFQDDTGNGADESIGHVWQERSYEFSTMAPDHGTVHVAIGVWGTWEASRHYFVDNVSVTFTPYS